MCATNQDLGKTIAVIPVTSLKQTQASDCAIQLPALPLGCSPSESSCTSCKAAGKPVSAEQALLNLAIEAGMTVHDKELYPGELVCTAASLEAFLSLARRTRLRAA
jgi:hypothetical protein